MLGWEGPRIRIYGPTATAARASPQRTSRVPHLRQKMSSPRRGAPQVGQAVRTTWAPHLRQNASPSFMGAPQDEHFEPAGMGLDAGGGAPARGVEAAEWTGEGGA